MATNEEKRALARVKFVHQGKTQKECAKELNVSTQTMSKWARAGHWRIEREARVSGTKSQVENVNIIISNIANRMVEAQRERNEAMQDGDDEKAKALSKELVGLGDQAGKVKGMLSAIEKHNKVSFSQYLEVMDKVFGDMQRQDEGLYMKTLDFQLSHIEKIAGEYESSR